jgi:hypothetical protein
MNNSTGDAGRYQCTRCPDRLPLVEVVDHLADHLRSTENGAQR